MFTPYFNYDAFNLSQVTKLQIFLSSVPKVLRMLSVLVVLVAIFTVVGAIGCLNESGEPVSWWAAVSQGSGSSSYYYLDANSASSSFTVSSYDVGSSTGGAIMNTVNVLYSGGDIAYALYNDEPPPDKTESSTYAHAKGVMVADDEGGYWLVSAFRGARSGEISVLCAFIPLTSSFF